MDTFRARIARTRALTKTQKELIVGSLLGDGYLVWTTRGYALRVNHSVKQKEYVDWKYRHLRVYTNSPPRMSGQTYYFRTVSIPLLTMLRKKFYRGTKKIVPSVLQRWMSPMVLAVWFMDDGSRDGKQARINTQSFTMAEQRTLQHFLQATLGIQTTINRDKNRFRLRIQASSMERFQSCVRPYVIPSMRYKCSL